jgi:hypothetical protein
MIRSYDTGLGARISSPTHPNVPAQLSLQFSLLWAKYPCPQHPPKYHV